MRRRLARLSLLFALLVLGLACAREAPPAAAPVPVPAPQAAQLAVPPIPPEEPPPPLNQFKIPLKVLKHTLILALKDAPQPLVLTRDAPLDRRRLRSA